MDFKGRHRRPLRVMYRFPSGTALLRPDHSFAGELEGIALAWIRSSRSLVPSIPTSPSADGDPDPDSPPQLARCFFDGDDFRWQRAGEPDQQRFLQEQLGCEGIAGCRLLDFLFLRNVGCCASQLWIGLVIMVDLRSVAAFQRLGRDCRRVAAPRAALQAVAPSEAIRY